MFSRISLAIAQPIRLGSGDIVPEFRAAWFHNFIDRQAQYNASLIGTGTPSFAQNGVPIGTDGADLGVGLDFAIAQSVFPARTAGFVQYDATWASHQMVNSVAAGVRMKW
jgi:uncharacterized protein with beta-barrel porin domain